MAGEITEPVNFLQLTTRRFYPNRIVILTGNIADNNPERVLTITVRHEKAGAATIEQMTMSFDEFEDLIEMVNELKKKLDKLEEVVL